MGDGHEITAIEINPKIAKIYQDFFPNDKVIVCDAHKFLLEHYKEFDFIWSSPPCPTHSVTNNFLNAQNKSIRFPDMKLYEEIIFLSHFFKGKFVIENVRSYYKPLIKPYECERHYFWSNFNIGKIKFKQSDFNLLNTRYNTRLSNKDYFNKLSKLHGFELKKSEFSLKLLRNCVKPELGLHIFKCAFKDQQTKL